MPSLVVLLRQEDAPDAAAIQEQVLLIEALPVVRRLSQLKENSATKAGFQAFLWCHAGHAEHGGCGKSIESAVQLTKGDLRPTLLACLQELRSRLSTRHTGCLAAAEAGRAAAAAASEPPPPPNALTGMHLREAASAHLIQLEATELAATAARKAGETEVASIDREYFPKRQRAADEEPTTHYSEWTPRTWLREETRVRGRRALKLGTYEKASAPRPPLAV